MAKDVYVLEFWTGAQNLSVFSTMDAAKEAFARYLRQWHPSCTLGAWTELHGACTMADLNMGEVAQICIMAATMDLDPTPV